MATPAPNLIKIVQSGPGYLIANTDDGKSVKLTGNANWRNNNPGNLRPTPFTQSQPGYLGIADAGASGTFAVFDSYENGSKAQQKLLFDTSAYRNLSIRQAISKYAPPSENNTEAYISTVTKALGVPDSTSLSSLSSAQQAALIKSIEGVEGYVTGKVETLSEVPPALADQQQEKVPEDSKATQIYVAKAPPIPNRLHEYPSYIYAISLHLMTNEQYNDCVLTQKYTPKNVLIASAGRYSDTFPRNKHFSEDFYFQDLNIVTIIAPNDQSRNTNAIDTKFTIIEPYGFTLVERILAATKDIGGDNYLDMPYMLQIDFFAIDDAGNLVGAIDELQKRFPIKLNKLDIRITERGAEYTINATPFPHEAFKGNAGTVPCIVEVTAKTVADFFQSIEGTANDTLKQDILAKADQVQRQQNDLKVIQAQNAPSLLYSSTQVSVSKSTVSADSLGSAINAYYQGLKENNKARIADVYRFEFLPDPDTGEDVIGRAIFVDQQTNTPKTTPMQKNDNGGQITMRKSDVGNSQNIYDPSRAIFNINYGTSIVQILEYVIRQSSYIQDQLVIPDGISQEEYQARREEMKNKPLKWFRIIPKTRLLGKDDIRGVWAKEYTYTVKPYKMYNVKNDLAPQGIVVTPTKNYNYFFTGQNDDVIDLNIEFNALYYSQQTAFRNSLTPTAPTADKYTEEVRYQNAPNYTGGPPSTEVDPNSVMPKHMKTVSQDSRGVATGAKTTADVAAADLAESLMTSSQADMIGVKMRIIGDPDYIKQDDVFYQGNQPKASNVLSTQIDPRLLSGNGSLVMDDGGVYVQVLFKVPKDIDDATGFMKYDAKERNSVFSGLYNVLQVTSNFSQGKFTQELEMVRLPRQIAFDYVGGNAAKSNARPATTTVQPVLGINLDAPVIPSILIGKPAATSTADAADLVANQTAGQDQEVSQINNAEQPTETPQQQDLRTIRDSGSTTTINEQNQNPPIPYPQPPKKTTLPSNVEVDPVSGLYIVDGAKIPLDNFSNKNNVAAIANASKSGAIVTVREPDPVSGRTSVITYNGETKKWTTTLE